jgi:16S rRNA (cytosine1402-N4)-methyltransferase
MNAVHCSVLLAESIDALQPRAGGIYLDLTYGRGGHSAALLDALGPHGRLHAFDQDPEACADAFRSHAGDPRFRIHAANFERLGELADLGVSSPQFDTAARGFSFQNDGPLDMRMNPQTGEPASRWLARANAGEIADVLFHYGEERNSRRIARRIVETRVAQPIETTAQLAALIAAVPGPRSKTIHPATRSFQAIRIFINRELDVLPRMLRQAAEVLAPGGRLAVISFHSLEDRIVKQFIRDAQDRGTSVPEWPPRLAAAEPASSVTAGNHLRPINRIFPAAAEIAANPRARSAVLRVAEKLPGNAS